MKCRFPFPSSRPSRKMPRLPRFDLAHKAPVSCYGGKSGNSLHFFFRGKGKKRALLPSSPKQKGKKDRLVANLVPRVLSYPPVTVFWASPRFGHPHSQIPSVLGIPGGGCPKR